MDYNYITRDPAAPDTHCPVCHSSYGKGHPPYMPPPPPPRPQVELRPATGPEQIAAGNGQAMSTGTLAKKHGWHVTPMFYRDANGIETCALKMHHRGRGRVMSLFWDRNGPGDRDWSYSSGLTWLDAGGPGTLAARGINAMRRLIESEDNAPTPTDPTAAQDGDPKILPTAPPA
jgi:hypothetical protein